MAMVKCKACSADISSAAASCPKCGNPRKSASFSAWWLVGVAAIGLYALSAATSTPTVAVAATPSSPVAPEVVAARAAEKIAKEVAFQKVVIFVKAVKSSMRDPDSFKLSSVGANADASVICMEYRGKNGYGGMAIERVSFAASKISQSSAQWDSKCAHQKGLAEMNEVEYAL